MIKKKVGLVFEQLMMGITGVSTSSIATAEAEQPDDFLEGKFRMKGTRVKRGVQVFFFIIIIIVTPDVK